MEKPPKNVDKVNLRSIFKPIRRLSACGIVALNIAASPVAADTKLQKTYTYTLFGTPGLIDLPTAQSAEDGEMAITVASFKGQTRTTLTFQLTPRLSGSFRYSSLDNWVFRENAYGTAVLI